MSDQTLIKDELRHALEAKRQVEPGGNLRDAWEQLLADAGKCTRCDLYKHATQTVFGEGPLDATICFVGEQPGYQEDLAGAHSSDRRAPYSMRLWKKPGSTGRGSMSPTPSSILNLSCAASDGSIPNRTQAKSPPAVGGWSMSAS